jgi:Protein of unknown function (DUF2934)
MAGQKTETAEVGAEETPTEEAIRQRAYEISQGDDAGSDAENWQRAEAELRGTPDSDGQA